MTDVTPAGARLRAGVLRYAALQFVVLTAIAMRVYPGGTVADRSTSGYRFFENFFSDLGATRSWSGQSNHVAELLFGIALAGLGLAMVAFAGTWRAFAFARGRARAAGVAGQLFGTASGLAFVGIAVTPVNLALRLHNTFVMAAFGLLVGYAACLTFAWSRNGGTRAQLATSVVYLALVCGYVAAVLVGVQRGTGTAGGLAILVVSQKVIAYASVLYVVYLTISIRRQLAAPPGHPAG